MRPRCVAPVALGCFMIAGCGSPGPVSRSPVSHSGACSGPARLGAGVSVAAWRLGAIKFVSPRYGVALTAPEIPCLRSMGNMGTEVTMLAQPVRLAVTEDGGHQ